MSILPEMDIEFLEEKGYNYQLIEHDAGIYLIIEDFEFPSYVPSKATMLINIQAGYDNTPLDMFFTIPDVTLPSGAFPNACAAHVPHNGAQWQQWSRHYTWRIGTDNLRTFITAIKREIAKGT